MKPHYWQGLRQGIGIGILLGSLAQSVVSLYHQCVWGMIVWLVLAGIGLIIADM
jgi:hypothetical protein